MFSPARKQVMMNSEVSAISSYAMLSFLFPEKISKLIDKKQRAFWWGQKARERKIQWVKWETIRKPQKARGMGFRDIQVVNLALLAKQGWRIVSNPMSLCTRVLKLVYFPKSHFLHKDIRKYGSW